MAVPTVNITGHVVTPDALAPASGKITIRLSAPGSAFDGPESVRVASEVSVELGVAGAVDIDLVANDVIVPSGTSYVAAFIVTLSGGERRQWSERWQLASTPNPVDLGEVPRLDAIPGQSITAVGAVNELVLAVATAAADSASTSATAAAASEAAASVAKQAAEGAKVAAESARDAAAATGKVFSSTTAGVAGTAAGEYFCVPTTGNDALILYLNVDDTVPNVSEKARFPATAVINAVAAGFVADAGDTAGNLLVLADRDGRPFAYWDGGARLYLQGDARSVQAVMGQVGQDAASSATDLAGVADANARTTQRTDALAGLWLPGMAETVQAAMVRARAGVPAPAWSGTLPASFTPFAAPLSGQDRYVWAGMRSALRPNNTRWVGFPFSWPTVSTFVDPSMVRKRVASYVWPAGVESGTLSTLTVNLPGGYSGVYQWRDLSVIYDRKLSRWWAVLNSIGTYASGFLTDRFACFYSDDGGTTWDFASYCIPGQVSAGSAKVWSPEWFVDDDGTVSVIVGLNVGADTQGYWVVRPDSVETMATWSVVGKITGSTLPTNAGGGYAMNDPYMLKRDGVYYLLWAAMSNATSVAGYQLGLSYSTSLLGPYDRGHSLTDSTGQLIRGEATSLVELPPGSPRRFRLYWFNVAGQAYGGRAAAAMFSPCVDTDDLVTFGPITNHGADGTYFQHNTAILGA